MKNFKKKLALIFATALVAFGFGGMGYLYASAETFTETEATKFVPISYRYTNEDNENQIIMFDLTSENSAVLRMIEVSGDGSSEYARINANYTIVDNIISVSAKNGEHLGDFYIGLDNQLTAIYYEETPPEETLTFEEIADIVSDYLASKKKNGKLDLWSILKDLKTWIIAGLSVGGTVILSAVYAAVRGHFKNKRESLSKEEMKEIATQAVQTIIGKSINLDVSAEVNKAVEKFMYSIKNELDDTFDMAKNTEILASEIALALSKSRLLTVEEQESLKADAEKVLQHAQKGGAAISAPAKVVIEKETEAKAFKAEVKEVATDSGYTLNFGGIQR